MSEEYQKEVERLETTRKQLEEALEALAKAADAAAAVPHIMVALRALDDLREFVVRDLGTAVGRMQHTEGNIESLGEFVNQQREAINDLSLTLAALVDSLVERGAIDGDELMAKKAAVAQSVSENQSGDKKPN